MPDPREQAMHDAAAWHEQELARVRRELAKGAAWAEENGEDNAGGYYTQFLPRYAEVHERAVRHFRRLAGKARRAALAKDGGQ